MAMLRDPAARELLGGSPRRWPVVLVAVAGSLALLGVLAVGRMAADGLNGGSGAGAASPVVPPAELPPIAPDLPSAERGVLVLPQPTGYEGAVPIGYPRSEAGAVAAAYGYSRLASGVDVAATLVAIGTMADPQSGWFSRERDSLADGLVEQRQGLGLPSTGPAMSAALSVTPSGYQILGRPHATEVRVLTLNVISASGVDGTRTTGVVVLDWALRWDGLRWVVTRMFSNSDHDELAVTPLTSEARALGWQVAQGG
jgi:hypothetical protein